MSEKKKPVYPNRRGRPPVEVQIQRDMAEAVKTLSELSVQNAQRLDKLTELMEKKAGEPEVKVSSREVEIPGFVPETMPPASDAPAVIFKSLSRGLKQVIKSSYKIARGGDDYEIVPPVLAEFEDGTLREPDMERVNLLRAKMERKKRMGRPVDIIEVKDEIAEALKDKASDVKAIPSETIKADTPVEQAMIS